MLKYAVEEGVAVITLDYAPTLNALDENMARELEQALQQAEAMRQSILKEAFEGKL